MVADGYYAGSVGGQWDDRSASASVALADAWLGSELGLVKVHGTVVGGPVEWLACAAAWLTPDAIAITAGDTAAISVIASRASIFGFMLFPIESIGSHGI
jgi:hypothetical protein